MVFIRDVRGADLDRWRWRLAPSSLTGRVQIAWNELHASRPCALRRATDVKGLGKSRISLKSAARLLGALRRTARPSPRRSACGSRSRGGTSRRGPRGPSGPKRPACGGAIARGLRAPPGNSSQARPGPASSARGGFAAAPLDGLDRQKSRASPGKELVGLAPSPAQLPYAAGEPVEQAGSFQRNRRRANPSCTPRPSTMPKRTSGGIDGLPRGSTMRPLLGGPRGPGRGRVEGR